MPSTRTDLDLPDVNVLVALFVRHHAHHRTALAWWRESAACGSTPVTESGLVRLLVNPSVAGRNTSPAAALAALRSWRSHPRARFLPDDTSLAEPQVDLSGLVGQRQVTDLHLLNLAARHDARLVTFDTRLAPTLQPADRDRVLTLV
jgi:toxin-antitoxin system PIN domain toxin